MSAEERRYDLDKTLSNRTRNCGLCGGRRVREHRRVGTPNDPDYAVAVCPACDLPTTKEASDE